ncbi:hypothetical protein HIM_12063 [Hirsutella minnesotensis 3608]|uniref:CCHC-type domain-containing protein n=1 Tax=Hirsutella minnesotensis 3608 TaxID=1043627 RepID=A0A0F7ZF54_9HYPO|nr:hypothetical protein HIM_12063 [Hirsutella minnesotensis 3608]
MRDQLYPVRVDNASRTAVLDTEGNTVPGTIEALSAENRVTRGKISRLSKRESGKTYGSMVVYLTKRSDAERLLEGYYFDLGGESVTTHVFEPRTGPIHCFNCQETGHKAYSCKKRRTCGNWKCRMRNRAIMLESLRILQLKARKRDVVQQSLMNDVDLKGFAALAISEPYARNIDGKVMTSPMGNRNWTNMIPTSACDASWPIRSMLWIRTVLQLADREVMVVSVYVEGKNDEALISAMGKLSDVIDRFRDGTGRRTDVILAGGFNRHDLLWGGDEVSSRRQGEGQPIVDLMSDLGLCNLLPRRTKTWQVRDKESTIDLVLVSSELADEMTSCVIHPTEHGSDHRAVQTTFDIEVPERTFSQRLPLRNAPWITIAARPPPYAKRWWTKDLTRLRRTYTYWRNQARTQRRAGQSRPDLERQAKEAAKEYHDNIRRQKNAHWDDFVADETNIWKAAKYLKSGTDAIDDKVPPLRRTDGSTAKGKGEQAEELLSTFFPLLPARIEAEGERPQRAAVAMPDLTLGEIEEKVMAAKPWKAPGEDGLPTAVWKKLWHVVKYRVVAILTHRFEKAWCPTNGGQPRSSG